MTSAHTAGTAAAAAATARTTAPRRVLRAVAIAACLPYLALKTAWLSGVHAGIPEGSELLDPDAGTALFLANSLTVAMDAAVVVLALALTLPWGRRLPAWVVALPLWAATGLLTPIVVVLPVQSLLQAATGNGRGAVAEETAASLDGWVFTMVYTGFGIQALALGGLFALYVRDRWGHLLRGRLDGLPASSPTAPARRATAVAAAVAALLPSAVHLVWATGSTAGLSVYQAERNDSVFRLLAGLDALSAAAAAAGVLLLAFPAGRTAAVRLRTAIALAWTGSAVLATRGGWTLLTGVFNQPVTNPSQGPTALMTLTYSVGMVVGVLVLAVGAHLFAERSAERPAGLDAGR